MTLGRLPEHRGEIIVPNHVALNGGIRYGLGDRISFHVGNRMHSNEIIGQHTPFSSEEVFIPNTEKYYTVVGFYDRPSFEQYTAPGYTVITMAEGEAEHFNLFITLKNPAEVHTYGKDIAGNYGYILNNNVLRFMGLSDNSGFNMMFYSFGGILAALIMVGSILLIYNSFAISLNERIQQFGILSSVGATPKQLRNSVLFEGVCIGAVGIPLGLIAGIGSIAIGISLVSGIFGGMTPSAVPLKLTVSAPALVIAAVVSLVTILVSAYIPARKAVKIPVMECIRQSNAVKIEAKAVKTSKLAEQVLGLPAILALKNFKRNKKRYRSIVLSLGLSIVLFVSASAFGLYLKQAAEGSVADVDYDICFSTKDMDEKEVFRLYEKLKVVEGVYDSSYQAILVYSCAVNVNSFSAFYQQYNQYEPTGEIVQLPMDLQFIEDSQYLEFIESLGLPVEEYTGENAKMTAVAKTNYYDENTGQSQLANIFTEPSITVELSSEMNYIQDIELVFVDTIPLDTLPRQSSGPKSSVFMVVAPYHLKSQFEISGKEEELGLTFLSENPALSTEQMEAVLKEEGITSEYDLYNVYQIMEQSRSIIFVVDVFSYGFIFMISLITIANVFNTISTNIRLRRRELAMLRSVGMTDRDFNKMMNFECIFYGTKALLAGLPIATAISWLIYWILDMQAEGIGFSLPWSSMGISIFSVFFVVFITMVYALGKIKEENIIDALRDDMT